MGKQLKKKLSDTERAFIDEYIANGYNATRAYMAVHKKVSYESARRLASLLLTNIDIRAEIDKRFKARAMGAEEVLARLSDMSRASHYPFIEIDEEGFIYFDFSSPEAKNHLHLIKKIKTKRDRKIVGKGEDAETWEGEWVEVELHDSQAALEKIAKILKLYSDPDDGEKFTAPQIVEIIKTYEKERE